MNADPMSAKPMTQTRWRLDGWEKVMANNPEEYTHNTSRFAVELLAATDAVLALHNSDGNRHFARSAANPKGETQAYCTHCQHPAPCPTVQAITEHTRNLP